MEKGNKNTVKISILVPVYKVEDFLARCVNSVLSQDFRDFELILVDDGSPDECPRLCDDFARKDNRVSVIHKVNGGLVSARLAGFQASKGEYLMFLDSDDWLFPNALTILYNKICEGYDVVKGNDLRVVGDIAHGEVERPKRADEVIYGAKEYLRCFLQGELLPYMWGGLYRRELFSGEIFNHLLDISIYEDTLTNIAIWRGVNRYATINETVQAYFINPNSMMQQIVVSHQYQQKVSEIIQNYIGDTNDAELLKVSAAKQMAAHLRGLFMPELPWNQQYYEKIHSFLGKEENYEVLSSMVDRKFLRLISYPLLFRLYTKIYRVLFKLIKQQNVCRRVK